MLNLLDVVLSTQTVGAISIGGNSKLKEYFRSKVQDASDLNAICSVAGNKKLVAISRCSPLFQSYNLKWLVFKIYLRVRAGHLLFFQNLTHHILPL